MAATRAAGFGAQLRRLRLAAGLTQEALAERAGLSVKAVSGLERNPGRAPRLDTVALLADALGLGSTERMRFLAAARPEILSPATPTTMPASPALPRPLTPLIGREGAVAAVVALLLRGEYRLITLAGPGGVGKTRMALAVADRVAGAFADGVVSVDLAPLRDPAFVLPTIAGCLGLDERGATPLAEQLTAHLHGKHLLLLLDNFEHLLAARDALLHLLEPCPHLIALVTSRAALRVRGERIYRVAPLELPDADSSPETLTHAAAATLFVERARAVGVEVEPNAAAASVVAAICHRLDGLPLALELAAAWARLMPLPALLARLERRLPMLVGGADDLPARQRTMRDAIAWSYELLDAPEQRLFRQLSVFAGGCTLEAAEAVADPAPDHSPPHATALVRLAVLVDRSLLRLEDGGPEHRTDLRLAILETIREYGLERLEADGEMTAAFIRHADHFLTLAEAAESALGGPDGAVWRLRLAREHDNLRAALDWLLKRGEGTRALRLAGALARFWSERGYLSEGRRWLREALATEAGADEMAGDARWKALVGAATLAIEQAAYDEATDLCEEAFALVRGTGQRVTSLNARGLLERARGRYAQAVRDHEEAYVLATESGDRAGAASALIGQATAAAFTDFARSASLAEQSVDAFRALGDARGLAEALLVVLWRAMNAADYTRAETLGAETLDLFRAVGDTGRLAEALFVLGVTAQFQGRYDRATALHEEGLALRRARGDVRGAMEQLSALAVMALQRDDTAAARTLLDETLATLQHYDDPWGRAMSLALLAQVELAAGAEEKAQPLLAESAAIFRAIGNLLYAPWCLEGLAGVATLRGEWERAAQICGVRDALRDRMGAFIPPAHPAGYERTLAAIRAALGAERFATAHAKGKGRSAEEALAAAAPPPHEGER